jgi:hypothetical protein
MTIPACDDCGHSSDQHTVECGCRLCDCPSLIVISNDEAEMHFARMAMYHEWMRRLGPRWARRQRRHRRTFINHR